MIGSDIELSTFLHQAIIWTNNFFGVDTGEQI